MSYLEVIDQPTDFYVATNGNDSTGDGSEQYPWATLQHALDYLQNYWLGSNVTIHIKAGRYTVSGQITVAHPAKSQINIVGETLGSLLSGYLMSSVYSTEGSAGDWLIWVNMNDVTGVAVGDYICFSDAWSGTKPNHILGCHKITAIDTNNKRIRFQSYHQHATPPSGNVTGYATFAKSVLYFDHSGSGYSVGLMVGPRGSAYLAGLILEGSRSHSGEIGLYVTGGGRVTTGGYSFGVSNWAGSGIKVDCGATAQFSVALISGCGFGVFFSAGSYGYTQSIVISGCDIIGLYTNYGSIVIHTSPQVTGCVTGVKTTDHSVVNMTAPKITSCTLGIQANYLGTNRYTNATLTDNGTDCDPTTGSRTSTNDYSANWVY